MSETIVDITSLINNIVEAHSRLAFVKPSHQRLRYIEHTEAGFQYVPLHYGAFCEQFAPENIPPHVVMTKYYRALHDAIRTNEDTRKIPRVAVPEQTKTAVL